jgi:hypothetical protein
LSLSSIRHRVPAAVLVVVACAAAIALYACGTRTQADAQGPGTASALVPVGPGVSESSQRSVVRTAAGRVYIASVDDDRLNGGAYAVLHMYRARQTGIPDGFDVADPGDEYRVSAPATLSGGDARLDGSGTIHLTFYDSGTHRVLYRTFSTAGDQWGPTEVVATLAGEQQGTRGKVLSALAIDRSGAPLIAVAGSTGVKAFHRGSGGGWVPEALAGDGDAVHPSLVVDRTGRAHLAWLLHPGGGSSIRYATRSPDGTWSAPETVAAGSVLANTTLDQSPSIAFDAANAPVVLYLDAEDGIRVRARTAAGWQADDPPGPVLTHTPGIYLSGNDRYVFLAHDIPAIHPAYITQLAGAAQWSGVTEFAAPAGVTSFQYDGSASPRFDPNFETDCRTIDIAFYDEDSDTRSKGAFHPDLYYAAMSLPASAGGCAGVANGPTHARGATRCRVPRLHGLTLAGARRRLVRAHCRLGRVTRHHGHHLRVRSQRPKAGAVVRLHAKVRVTLWPRRRR